MRPLFDVLTLPPRALRATALSVLLAAGPLQSQNAMPTRPAAPVIAAITTPEKFFGFRMGADRKMARWDKMVEYYTLLAKQSPRIKVVNMGPTTMGNPFLAVFVSSPANLARLETLRTWNLRLADPRAVPEPEIRRIVRDGKAFVLQSMSMHANEIGGSQMAPELIYDLAARNDVETLRILDNVVSIMVPGFNPDGQIWMTDWYNKYVGTEYEGSTYPSLYQKYVGHDNNRDAFMSNMIESQYMSRLLFRDWKPEAYVDHHHMGGGGARIFLPPYAEPVRPFADPLVWRELSWYGAHMAYKEEEANLSGVINMAIYSGWGHMGFHWITPFHNIAGMLTESASASLASPVTIPKEVLSGGTRGLPKYEEQTTFPNPWPGGVWRLRDIVDRQKVSAWATLDLAARNKETVLENAYLKAKRQSERGAAGAVKAYVVAINQHDPLTVTKMVNKLIGQGVDVHRAAQAFTHEGKQYASGSYVVSMAQPKMGVVRWLLGQTFYPDNSYTRNPDGTPIRPYDMSTDTMNEFMGVTADPVSTMVSAPLTLLTGLVSPAGTVTVGSNGYLLDGKLNDAARAANLLLDKNVTVRRVDKAGGGAQTGDFVVAATAPAALVASTATTTGVNFVALNNDVSSTSHALKRMRIAMYERYGGGNIDHGWTQFTLEQFGFPYTDIKDAELKAGNLNAKYDVLILPADNSFTMLGGGRGGRGGAPAAAAPAAAAAPTAPPAGRGGGFGGQAPPEYRSGFDDDGVAAIKAFVQAGGTLLTFGEAGALAIDRFALPLKDVVAGKTSKEFWSPGSTFHAKVDNANALGYGMPADALITWMSGSQAYDITDATAKVETIVSLVEKGVLQSGQLTGEPIIAKKSVMVAVPYGTGRVVLIGFRAQHRAQTHGTYKLVFNALLQ
ncbi:MAG: M14 family metallopeptidase [Gemmatimonas sp.]